ncbi:MAG: zinc ribbon domain-containing protein [Bacillales bacterium]|nr:zinc ribbon domain-containing protein [Bacillales bacterium]MDY5920461.1 zinc ribbon domain-containing protein [Candidatus Enteromonas sp.]
MSHTKPKNPKTIKTSGIVFLILASLGILLFIIGAILSSSDGNHSNDSPLLSIGCILFLFFLGPCIANLVCHAKIMKQAKEVDGKKDFSSVGTKGMRKTGFILLIVSLSLLVVFGIVLAITLTEPAKGMVTPIWIGYVFVPLAIASVLMLSASIAVLNASRFGDKTKQAPKKQKPVASKGSDKSSPKGESPILGDVSILGNRAGMVLSFAIAFLILGIYAILSILGLIGYHGEGSNWGVFLVIGGVLGLPFLGASIAMFAVRASAKKKPALDFTKARKIDIILLCVALAFLVGGIVSLLFDIFLDFTWHMIVFVTLPIGIVAFSLLGVSIGRFASHRILKSQKPKKAIFLPILIGALAYITGLTIDLTTTLISSEGNFGSSMAMIFIPTALEAIGGITLLVALIIFFVRRAKKKKAASAASPAKAKKSKAEAAEVAPETAPEVDVAPAEQDAPSAEKSAETTEAPRETASFTAPKEEPKPVSKPAESPKPTAKPVQTPKPVVKPAPAKKASSPVPAGHIRCQHCGTINEDKKEFCSSCGRPLDIKKVCFNCYELNDPKATVCAHCGSHLD